MWRTNLEISNNKKNLIQILLLIIIFLCLSVLIQDFNNLTKYIQRVIKINLKNEKICRCNRDKIYMLKIF